ncbi:PCMP-H87, partial [Symbiodinium sp. CCMP2592]
MRRGWAPRAPKAPAVQKLAEAAEAGHVEEARRIFDSIGGYSHRKPFLWNLVLKAYVKAADPAGAEDWLRQLSAVIRPTGRSFGKMIAAAATLGHIHQAEFFLRAEEQAHLTPDAASYGAVLDACEKAGDPGRTAAWAGRLARVSLAPDV